MILSDSASKLLRFFAEPPGEDDIASWAKYDAPLLGELDRFCREPRSKTLALLERKRL
jgi:hypothetical protein